MEAQMHSFWRLIFLRHLFAAVSVGCFKAEPCAAQGNPRQSSCCSTAHPWEGLVGSCWCPGEQECSPDIHRAPSLPFCHSRSCAGDRNDSYSDHSMHSPGLLIIPLPKGQLGALLLLLLFWPFPGEHSFFFLQLTWTKRCHELLLNGLQMEAAAGG